MASLHFKGTIRMLYERYCSLIFFLKKKPEKFSSLIISPVFYEVVCPSFVHSIFFRQSRNPASKPRIKISAVPMFVAKGTP